MALSKSPEAFKLKTLFIGSLGEIPESHARTAGQKQSAAWIKEASSSTAEAHALVAILLRVLRGLCV